ncbi:MAG: ABC transporter substrate-binding protein [Lachnospiraceae bacterium]
MKQIRKILTIILVIILVFCFFIILFASFKSEKNIASEQKVILKTVSMFGGTDGATKVYNEINNAFMEKNSTVLIEDNSQNSSEEWKNLVAADFSVGNEPDVLQFFTDATANQIVRTDKFVTVKEIVEVYPEYAKDIYDWALLESQNTDGVSRAIPTVGYWEGLYCNKDLFDKYNIVLPYDWDSLLYAIDVFKSYDVIPIACSLYDVPHYWLENFMLYTQGYDEYTTIPMTVEETWIEALDYFSILRNKNAFPDNTDTVGNDYIRQLFVDKQAAMILEGSWFFSEIQDQENTVVIPFPGVAKEDGYNHSMMVGGISSGFYITRKAWNDEEKREIAVKFVMEHTKQESIQKYWENGGGVAKPASEVFLRDDMTNLELSAIEYIEKMEYICSPTDSRMDPEAYKILLDGIVAISHGGDSRELLEQVLAIHNERK